MFTIYTYVVHTCTLIFALALVAQKCNVLVDVGSVYDPTIHRYDHHQRSFTNTLDGFNTKLSSAGLIYKHFGRAIIKRLLDTGTEGNSPAERNVMVDICYNKLYRSFIEHIDAIDNGVTSTESGELRCHLSTSLSARVGQLNPRWNQPQNSTIQNMQFTKALALTSGEFLTHVDEILASWYPARSIVQKAMKERFSTVDKEGAPVVAADGKIILLDRFCPWKDHVYEMEQQVGIAYLSIHPFSLERLKYSDNCITLCIPVKGKPLSCIVRTIPGYER